ncbi:hypothetical protein [Roseomonas rosulenta]|uniref:hypothetical protein n=1 Tax=Roseomonas rosulenta TaxID=2748667 RepID=UPI0018DF91CE|nr:hypothetical protein [Roseomonas rosulenta]
MGRIPILAALGTALAAPVPAAELAAVMQVHLTPRGVAGEAGCTRKARINLPPAWRTGDAVVVLLTDEPLRDATRDPLVATLFLENAAVLAVSPGTPAVCVEDAPGASQSPGAPDALDMLFGGLVAARQEAGGGLVVAIGYGPGSAIALAAGEEGEAAARLGQDTPRFAAALALGDGAPAARRGGPQAAAERSDERLGLLCAALARSGVGWGAASAPTCIAALGAEPRRTALRHGP